MFHETYTFGTLCSVQASSNFFPTTALLFTVDLYIYLHRRAKIGHETMHTNSVCLLKYDGIDYLHAIRTIQDTQFSVNERKKEGNAQPNPKHTHDHTKVGCAF